jgi:hypothetical protein
VVPGEQIAADKDAIRRDLQYMTRRWHELSEPAQFEIRAFGEGKQTQTALFQTGWIEEAVEWIAGMNALRFNCYAVRNPIRMSVTRSASDADIIAAFYLWADCDDPAAAGNVRRFDGPRWSANVTTGRTPDTRVHVYWELDTPCADLGAWRQLQSDLAAHFKSDPSVINPSRIMRIGGTVNWPAAHKRAKGYATELCTIRTEYDDQRGPVTFDQMRRVFPVQGAHSAAHSASVGGFNIDTGAPTLDRALAAANILAGNNWRENVKKLVASYVARGWTDDEIVGRCLAFTLDGWTAEDTRKDVAAFIAWTRDQEAKKGGQYATSPEGAGGAAEANPFREMSDAEREEVEPIMFAPWGHRDLAAIPCPQFVYSDFYARGYTSVTLAPPKVGKSMLGLAEALDMASGRGFLTGTPRERLRVVYYNAEDDQSVIDSRVAALLTLYGIEQADIADTLFPVSGVDRGDFFMVSGQDGIINEKLFVGLEKFITGQRADVLIFDPLQDLSRSPETNEVFRLLGQRMRRMASSTAVALGLIHHTRKIAPGVTATIDDGRGGSALRGTARFNRLLISMTEDEAIKAGVVNHRHFMRIGDMESNLAPPSSNVNRWFEKVSVPIPNGSDVGAVKAWQWPDAFAGVTAQDAARVRSEIDRMPEPPRHDVRSAGWVGAVVADVLGLDLGTASHKARIKAMIQKWVETDVLRLTEGHDQRAGRTTKVVICGANNPLSESRT